MEVDARRHTSSTGTTLVPKTRAGDGDDDGGARDGDGDGDDDDDDDDDGEPSASTATAEVFRSAKGAKRLVGARAL